MSTSKRAELGQIVIRPPEGMRERIKAAADANNRSMNAEIVATLEEKYPAPMLPGVDVELSTMTEWLNFIDGAEDEAEFERRLNLVNTRLAASKTNKAFRVRTIEFPGAEGKSLFISFHGMPDFNSPYLEKGRVKQFPKKFSDDDQP